MRELMMRRVVVAATAATLVMSAQPPAQAHHRPTSYCSPTADICQNVRKVDGVRKLRLTLAAKFFGRYKLCVTEPADITNCKIFRIRELGDGTFGGSVRFWKHFSPVHDLEGRYAVKWCRANSDPPWKCDRIGEVLGFHVH